MRHNLLRSHTQTNPIKAIFIKLHYQFMVQIHFKSLKKKESKKYICKRSLLRSLYILHTPSESADKNKYQLTVNLRCTGFFLTRNLAKDLILKVPYFWTSFGNWKFRTTDTVDVLCLDLALWTMLVSTEASTPPPHISHLLQGFYTIDRNFAY